MQKISKSPKIALTIQKSQNIQIKQNKIFNLRITKHIFSLF